MRRRILRRIQQVRERYLTVWSTILIMRSIVILTRDTMPPWPTQLHRLKIPGQWVL